MILIPADLFGGLYLSDAFKVIGKMTAVFWRRVNFGGLPLLDVARAVFSVLPALI